MVTELEFRSRRSHVLRGSLHRPAAGAAGGVIVCHGMLSSKESEKHVAVCEKAAGSGLTALRFDFARLVEAHPSLWRSLPNELKATIDEPAFP